VTTPVFGLCPPRFEPVRAAFAANFEGDFPELGARFCAAIEGEVVLDLWGGHADRDRTRAFDQNTLTPVFSSSKAMAALMCAWSVGQGQMAYDQPAAQLWPALAQAGKAGLSVEQVLSHQAGLCGLREAFDPNDYHASTFGHLAGELFRRADGRTLGRAMREELCEPFGLDLWIGLPEDQDHRVAETMRPPTLPDLGKLTEPKTLAFFKPWSAAPAKDLRRWRAAEFPATNGHATAAALARMMTLFACDGQLDGREVLPPGLALEAARGRISGTDLVLPYSLSWGAGLLRNESLGVYGPSEHAFGHSGWGGSCVAADPERRLSLAYVMNRQSAWLIGDPRPGRLIKALYDGL